jgi:hypothetical protein
MVCILTVVTSRSLANYNIDYFVFISLYFFEIVDCDKLDLFSLQEQGKGGRHGKTINIFSIASGHL